jgi:hypothetical protein
LQWDPNDPYHAEELEKVAQLHFRSYNHFFECTADLRLLGWQEDEEEKHA